MTDEHRQVPPIYIVALDLLPGRLCLSPSGRRVREGAGVLSAAPPPNFPRSGPHAGLGSAPLSASRALLHGSADAFPADAFLLRVGPGTSPARDRPPTRLSRISLPR